ncbi:unnamed protein product [Symbiodinium microadriaticum]|nr:unnamed protein product [Symbiodinium microadriaticum]
MAAAVSVPATPVTGQLLRFAGAPPSEQLVFGSHLHWLPPRPTRRSWCTSCLLVFSLARTSQRLRQLRVRDEDRSRCSAEVMLDFERKGFLKMPQILAPEEVDSLSELVSATCRSEECVLEALRHQIRVQYGAASATSCWDIAACRAKLRSLERRGEISFLQYFNLHRHSGELRELALSPRFAFWASRLLGVPRVRLYQDALFEKRPGDGATDWHSDLGLAPFDTNSFVTIWLPLTSISMKGSSLVYAISSHKDFVPAPGVQVSRKRHESLVKARKRGMSPHSWIAAEALPFLGDVDEDLSGRYKLQRLELGSRHFGDFFVGIWSPGTGGLVPGDATAHHGWTLHSAAGIPKTAPPRLAWTLGFVADGARLRRGELELGEDAVSYEAWAKELGPGARVEHPMVPLLSTRALAELELILAEAGGKLTKRSPSTANLLQSLQSRFRLFGFGSQRSELAAPEEARAASVAPRLEDFDGLCLKLQTLELTPSAARKIRAAESVWLRCGLDLGRGQEDLLVTCPTAGLAAAWSRERRLQTRLFMGCADSRLQVKLLIKGQRKGGAAHSTNSSNSAQMQTVAQAELLWFAALLDPGSACPFVAELTEGGKAGAAAVGRLQLSLELTSKGEGPRRPLPTDECNIHVRLWLGTFSPLVTPSSVAELRAVLKLGQQQEISMSVQKDALGIGRDVVFGQSAVSASSIWQVQRETFACKGPCPACIFVQLWSGAELCGLAKLLLEPFHKESAQELISLQGYRTIFDGELDVSAVVNDTSIGKLQVCAHAGLAPVLLQLSREAPQLEVHVDPRDVSSALLLLAHQSFDLIAEGLKAAVLQHLEGKQLAEALQDLEPLLTFTEASALVNSIKEGGSRSVETSRFLELLRSRMLAVQESFDQVIREVGDEAGSLALDFLEVGNPAWLQRQDVARALKFRGLDLSWACLEGVFLALGCPEPSGAVCAEKFARLFRHRAELTKRRRARLRHLEAEALAQLRAVRGPNGSRQRMEELVLRHSRADGTLDALGLTVMLEEGPSLPRTDVDDLVQLLFERFGVKPGGRVSSTRVLQWLVGTQGSVIQSSLRDVDLNSASQPAQLLAKLAAAKLPAQVPLKAEPQPEPVTSPLTKQAPAEVCRSTADAEATVQATLQLARPLRSGMEQQLSEVLAASLGLETARLRVLGAEEGASRICVQMRPRSSSSQDVVAKLARQLGDPASSLAASSLGAYFC